MKFDERCTRRTLAPRWILKRHEKQGRCSHGSPPFMGDVRRLKGDFSQFHIGDLNAIYDKFMGSSHVFGDLPIIGDLTRFIPSFMSIYEVFSI